jgi:uncharacterized protein (DUF2235 family)
MTKSIAIFCDGTWNDLSLDTPTNVVRLAKCVAPVSRKGQAQIVFYDEGVGVAANISRTTDTLTKLLGGAFGRGLDRKIEAAYRFLVLNYEPGDDIYVFGFSRGAYTARSLCGLIRKCGILKRSCFNKVPEALGLYRNASHPAAPEMVQFRDSYAHKLASGSEDSLRVADKATDSSVAFNAVGNLEELYQYRPASTYRMMYVGLWDTVGEMGVPRRVNFLGLNKRYAFHDTKASSLMCSIRHAIALNEKRGLFDSTPVDNIDDLNIEWAQATGWDVSDDEDLAFVPYSFRPYQQRWFPGDHCSVGGGYEEIGLSSSALLWVAEGAARSGLTFIDSPGDELDKSRQAENPYGDLGKNAARGFPSGRLRRKGPPNVDCVADTAHLRYFSPSKYKPPNLTVLMGANADATCQKKLPVGFPTA